MVWGVSQTAPWVMLVVFFCCLFVCFFAKMILHTWTGPLLIAINNLKHINSL